MLASRAVNWEISFPFHLITFTLEKKSKINKIVCLPFPLSDEKMPTQWRPGKVFGISMWKIFNRKLSNRLKRLFFYTLRNFTLLSVFFVRFASSIQILYKASIIVKIW